MHHDQQSPFPFTTPKGGTIVDELCSCGALRSEHRDTIAYGHGPRIQGDLVVCDRFTFVEFIFALPKGYDRADGRTAVKVRRGNGGWRVEAFLLENAEPVKWWTTTAKVFEDGTPVRSKADAIKWAAAECRYTRRRGKQYASEVRS